MVVHVCNHVEVEYTSACTYTISTYYYEAVFVVNVWYLDLQLPMQSVPITTETVSSNPTHGEVHIL